MTTTEDWVEQARRLVAGLGQTLVAAVPAEPRTAGEPTQDSSASPHGADCRWCPLCQAVAVLRGERPEVTAALADALGAAAAALRALTPERPPTEPPPAGAEHAGAGHVTAEPATGAAPGPRPAGPVVQHIEIA